MTTHAPILDQLNALADLTRGRLLLLLEAHEMTVGELCAALKLPQSTVSRHLKLLTDDGWTTSRGEGTSRFYSMARELDLPGRELWGVVRGQIADLTAARQDTRRAAAALAKRQSRMRSYFSDAAPGWDSVREDMIGGRTDLLALIELMDERWVVGDLGCGVGHATEALAPCVRQVVAIDESGPMLEEARRRLAPFSNVELREGHLEAVPIESATLDVALLFLVAHFIADPAQVLREVRRVLVPGGRVVIVDLVPHDRVEFVAELGHVWQGFTREQIEDWLATAGFRSPRYRTLPHDPAASGPPLFVASSR
jgi:ubiquinone/menaquinone biosynthesis C-methylase UbiE